MTLRRETREEARSFRRASGAPELALEHGRLRLRFARDLDDLDRVLRLRFAVFNLELGEGLASAHETGRDQDRFDAACHHLMVEDARTGQVVGTYRMQTREMAARGGGFYAAGEFDLGALPAAVLDQAVEIGRACIAPEYRNRQVLFLLWRGLAAYLVHAGKRYLFGCCSLTGTDPRVGIGALEYLRAAGHVHPDLRVAPLPGLECRLDPGQAPAPFTATDVPRLFQAYLRHGARTCGPPAIDRDFGTIDFLVALDAQALDRDVYRLYF
jgi:putative hemolysin